MNFITFHILGMIIPTDFHILSEGLKPPTRYIYNLYTELSESIVGFMGDKTIVNGISDKLTVPNGLVNVLIQHHPIIRGIISNRRVLVAASLLFSAVARL